MQAVELIFRGLLLVATVSCLSAVSPLHAESYVLYFALIGTVWCPFA